MVWARLPRTTERPLRKRRSTQRLSTGGDSPRERISAVKTLNTPLTTIIAMDGFYGARTFFMSARTRADLARATAFTETMPERR